MAKTKKKMTCPYPDCGCADYKTLKSGSITRCCDREVKRVNGGWYLKRDDAPEWRILQKFAEWKRKSDPEYVIGYNSQSYQQQVGSAHNLYKYCGFNLELAFEVLSVSFTHEAHRWRNYPSLWAVLHKKFFMDVLAKARIAVAKRENEKRRQEQRVSERRDTEWGKAYELARRAAV